jgi:RHS repeat-associated protein
MTGDGTKTYQWDAANRLVAVLQGATTLASFVYDGSGKRQQKIAAGVTHTSVYDEANIVEERVSGGATLDYVQMGLDRTLAQRDQAGVVTYYLADHLGSIDQITSSNGAVTLTREYDPWGNLLQGSATSGYAFTGREWDSETGLYYYRARYYPPSMARWLSEDPARPAHGQNLYQYVRNSSVNGRDPSGLVATRDCNVIQRAELELAAELAAEKVTKCPDCLPKGKDPKEWANKIRSSTYHCGGSWPGGYCAWAGKPDNTKTGRDATFWDKAFEVADGIYPPSTCGCLKGTLLHEVSHLMGYPDKGTPNASGIAASCFSCAVSSPD